jgi:hypothetical protein
VIEIVIEGSAARIEGMVRQVGTRVAVPDHTAHAFVRAGRARIAEAERVDPPVTAEVTTTTSTQKPKRR